jgi:hypothetical protein
LRAFAVFETILKDMKISVKQLKRLIKESIEDDDLNSVEVGDVVDVSVDEMGILPVRVIELVDDVNASAGPEDPRSPGEFSGPGFVGEIDPESGESGQLVFSLNQVLPGSKAKGYFPKLGDKWDEDDWGRQTLNPYRKMATRFATKAIEPEGSYVSGLSDTLGDD